MSRTIKVNTQKQKQYQNIVEIQVANVPLVKES
jgi:hypothetical protein